MGRISETLIAVFREQTPDGTHAAEQFAEGLSADLPSAEEMAKEGYDAQHVVYIAAQNIASLFAESVSELDEFEEWSEAVAAAEDEYMPSSPPLSPITQSFFWTWALFDRRFGPDQETMGGCLHELLHLTQTPEALYSAVEKYSRSRMGIYEHCGARAGRVKLRELVTGNELLCHSTSGYQGDKNELWFARLCPPLADQFDYHVSVTTPYVLSEASAEDWTAFLNKHLLDAEDKYQTLHDLLKYGNERINWMEFVFQAYHDFQYDAIFLTGIPDVPASLPHSPLHDETEPEAKSGDEDDSVEMVRVKLTEAQRKAIAAICPQLSSRLRLAEKNQRTIDLRQSELQRVIAQAREALPSTTGARRTPLKKIIRLGEPSSRKPSSAATVYQFKIILAESDPPIWRRIQTEDCTLAEFHSQIQGAMGWLDSHLHEFNIAGERYAVSPPLDMGPMEMDAIDASTVRLSQLIGVQKKFDCRYLYDFGDSWEHLIEFEEICAAEPKARYPRCIGGAQACPPEDCGGIWGFYEFVAAMIDRDHPEHRDLKEWYGCQFKPSEFDKQKASRDMRRFAK